MSILPELSREDLWIFTFDKKKARYKDFSKFCHNNPQEKGHSKLSKQTMTNYIKDLVREKKLEKGLEPNAKYPHYFIPETKHNEVRALKEQRLFTKQFGRLSESERAIVLRKRVEKEHKQILRVLALDGPIFISEIAEKTGFTKTKILETLWGPLLNLGLFSCNKNYHLSSEEWKYGLGLCGLYRTLRENMDKFEVIAQKWGYLHPFIFNRINHFDAYGLVEPLKEFLRKVKPYSYTEGEEKTRKEIEQYLVAFIVSNYNHRYIMAWLKFMRGDRQFRERIEGFFKEKIAGYELNIKAFERALGIVGKLGRHSEPNWDEMKWDVGPLHGLESFIHFTWMNDD